MNRDLPRQLRAVADETRLRMLHLLGIEEVAVSELAAAMNVGQSRVSTQLQILREVGLVRERREGKRTFVTLARDDGDLSALIEILSPRIAAMPQCRLDAESLVKVLERRKAEAESDPLSSGIGRHYLPGRTWEGLARTLIELIDIRSTMDIGVGDLDLTLLLASFSKRLVAVDPVESVLARGRARAEKVGARNIEFRAGEIENLPAVDGEFDLVFASQVLHHARSPKDAIVECARVVRPKGRLVILDLLRHEEVWVKDRLGHQHLGFAESTLERWMKAAGLADVSVKVVARDTKPPRFITLAAIGVQR